MNLRNYRKILSYLSHFKVKKVLNLHAPMDLKDFTKAKIQSQNKKITNYSTINFFLAINPPFSGKIQLKPKIHL